MQLEKQEAHSQTLGRIDFLLLTLGYISPPA